MIDRRGIDGLIVKERWAKLILNGEKTIELRGTNTAKRGQIAIIISGTQCVYGFVEIIDTFKIETNNQYESLRSKHCVGANRRDIKYKTLFAWCMSNPIRLKSPVRYSPKLGQQVWVKNVIDKEACMKICRNDEKM